MLCTSPFVGIGGQAFGCGQCLPCRINRRRIWTHRIKLEAVQYADNAFLTLTYADDMLPPQGSLVPEHLKLFMYRVRTAVRRSEVMNFRKVRFFAVGEYGDLSFRPHYHVVLFNFPSCLRGGTRFPPKYSRCCVACDFIYDLWYDEDRKPYGKIQLDAMSDALASYIGGYVTKKMTKKDDPRLQGRHPEFARQSLRPGIGAGALHEVADVLMRYYDVAGELGDVPCSLSHGRSKLPLGRYMRGKLREMVGMDKHAPQITLDKISEEMRDVRMAARSDNAVPSIKAKLIARDKGRVASVVSRSKVFKQRRGL